MSAALLFPAGACAVEYSAPSAKLGSSFFDWDALVLKPTEAGSRCTVLDRPSLTFDRLVINVVTLRPGATTPPAAHNLCEKVILAREGGLELWLDGKTSRLAAGSLIFLERKSNYHLTNVGDRPATWYEVEVSTGATGLDVSADRAGADRLSSSVFDVDRLPEKSTATGSSRWFVDAPTETFRRLICHTTTLNPGQVTAFGYDEADELIFVRSGVIEPTLNGVSCRLGFGSFFFQASNDLHGTRNPGAVPATYLVIKIVSEKTPPPKS
jgi:quercetin dioxygenase-like cupin family protein